MAELEQKKRRTELQEGESLPEHTFSTFRDGPTNVTTDELFKGKKVVMFAVPGAFTPTCSEKHLPGFVEHAKKFTEKGVDSLICLSVNDVFVMKCWGKDQKADDIVMLADGDASFTQKIGLVKDTGAFGGIRSQRYAMVVEDGVVKKLFIDKSGFELSSAEHVLGQL